ncbi:histidinol-phosphatase [Spirochaeta thermophila]|uniref:Histidinol-phosphatase n=1 Tax=Winmispira thermophila (strain ATCC 49972 / DSM 6192 / RI 19.B1) TaxID=665571 RepID=E0RNN0_WINT6|nr:histidinol-phosphatase [Spirochaeta thermophila]ADN02621.1 probable histidinol-phosphatase [Spirochaeta thermophila DSM 6192]
MYHTNYHTHTSFCDGKGKPEDYFKAAESRGLLALGFSSHAPLPYKNDWTMKERDLPAYREAVETLKRTSEKLDIYLGLEIDYLPPHLTPADERFQPLDFTIGAVHVVEDAARHTFHEIDGHPKDYKACIELFGGIQPFVEWYYRQVAQMCRETPPTIVAHLDLIKKNNQRNEFFTEEEPWYRNAVASCLDVIAEVGSLLEVNTGGLARKCISTIYPSPWILRLARERDIPLVLSSDAHDPAQVDFAFDEAVALMKEAGYTKVYALLGGEWIERPLE